MKFLCIKYSGLRFNYIFESTDFIFIPTNIAEGKRDLSNITNYDFFSCSYDKSAQFYVICKKELEHDLDLQGITDELLFRFRFLEAIIGLLFSNRLHEDSIVILLKKSENYEVLNVIKNISKNEFKTNPIHLWKNDLITERLKDIINEVFHTLDSLNDPKAFSLKYFFCFDMYLKGKFSDNNLNIISYLWICLEILSSITIGAILNSNEPLFPEIYKKKLQEEVEKFVNLGIPEQEVKCWEKLKVEFKDHIKNKINTFLPIRQKVIKMAEEYCKIEEFKIPFRSLKDFNNPNEYRMYEEKIRDFKNFQDTLSIKKIIDNFFDFRNALFHSGGLPDIDNTFERQKSYFCMLIERLFFKILNKNLVNFKLWDGLEQYLWIDVGVDEDSDYFRNPFFYITRYEETNLITQKKALKDYYNNREDLFLLIDKLNEFHNDIESIMGNPIQLLIRNNENTFRQDFELDLLNGQDFSFEIKTESDILSLLFTAFMEKYELIVESSNKEKFSIKFKGFLQQAEFLGDLKMSLDFMIFPKYINFKING